MKFTVFVATFLAVASAAQAGNPPNAVQLSASAQDDQEDIVLATPAPTTFADIPTPAPTNFSDPTPAPTFPTAAPTESADPTPTTTSSNSEDATQSESTAGIVGVAYSSEGTVGVAYATTRSEYEAEKNSSDSGSTATVPIVVVGCLVGVLGAVVAVVVMRKRKAVTADAEEGETDYSNAIHTPAAAGKTDYSNAIQTPAAVECETDYSDDIPTPVV